jgi:uncharacterized protein YbaA (DUF1428 family)
MAKYVDGFVLVVPTNKLEQYKEMARDGARTWMECGALEYMECMGDDLVPKDMGGVKPLAFTEMARAQSDETVWFSFIVYESKAHRDEVNAKVMALMEKEGDKYKDVPMPFDMKRFAYGGFEVAVEG